MSGATHRVTMSGDVFKDGGYPVATVSKPTSDVTKPPKLVMIAYPSVEAEEAAEFGVVMLLHGYMLSNSFYSHLIKHIASYGFIVVAPQLYEIALADSTGDIKAAAAITFWLATGVLEKILPPNLTADVTNRFAVAGHSRGGKDAFGLALGIAASSSLRLSALIGIDPVAGTICGQTAPAILSDEDGASFTALNHLPVMVIGSGLDDEKGGCIRCTPKGVSHKEFYRECERPACYFVVKGYGHLDVLDDDTPGIKGLMSYFMCKKGASREPMRRFVAGVSVAFLKAYLDKDDSLLMAIKAGNAKFPVGFDNVHFRL
ncbi:hypothetical protein V2J09_020320 [Rumex salicifolius]